MLENGQGGVYGRLSTVSQSAIILSTTHGFSSIAQILERRVSVLRKLLTHICSAPVMDLTSLYCSMWVMSAISGLMVGTQYFQADDKPL
jgi:hypothetical protein